jgi:EmrB/QacA subfamily drug resistance transporter
VSAALEAGSIEHDEPEGVQSGTRRWAALGLVCFGALMIVLDGTIVNIALPSIQRDLGFTQSGLAWVVNAYVLTFGGFLLLGGRAADLIGRRAVFVAGLAIFTAASLACGLAPAQWVLVAARAVQGIGGAIVQAVAFSLILELFREPGPRAKAMSVWGFVSSAGGAVGVVLGGVLTQAGDWHLIFLLNVPIGIVAIALARPLLPASRGLGLAAGVDLPGALAITAAPILAVFGILQASDAGWTSPIVLAPVGIALVVLAAFVRIERRAIAPIVPLRIFRSPVVSLSQIVIVAFMTAFFGWFFFSPLYMQRVLGFGALLTGLGFLPAMLAFAAMSLGIAAWVVGRIGQKRALLAGMSLAVLGLVLLARTPVAGVYPVDVLPAMLLIAVGGGLGFLALILIATGEATPQDSGLVSGLVSTSQMVGGAIGLAVLVSLAATRSAGASADPSALNDGYHLAFGAAAALTAGGLIVATRLPVQVLPDPTSV